MTEPSGFMVQTTATAGKMGSSWLERNTKGHKLFNLRIQIGELKSQSGQRQGRKTKELTVGKHFPEALQLLGSGRFVTDQGLVTLLLFCFANES